ncbi:hypothetical protein ABIB37_002075 [Agrococcus sp. UYP10]|uniref:hypothetical protein n=1 Tax=Agrococcus sp. UYP10 TaxID=1756355 RepID=UPI0033944695
MPDKQLALDLIEAARQGYRSLLRRPPKDDNDYRERKQKADWQLDAADTIVRGMGSDYRTVADVFGMVNHQIEVMDAKIGVAGSDAEQYLDETESWDPFGVDEQEPDDVRDQNGDQGEEPLRQPQA